MGKSTPQRPGEWRPFLAGTTRPAPCYMCGTKSSWHPAGWIFRYVPMTGGGKHDPRVISERLCPSCVERLITPLGEPLSE